MEYAINPSMPVSNFSKFARRTGYSQASDHTTILLPIFELAVKLNNSSTGSGKRARILQEVFFSHTSTAACRSYGSTIADNTVCAYDSQMSTRDACSVIFLFVFCVVRRISLESRCINIKDRRKMVHQLQLGIS